MQDKLPLTQLPAALIEAGYSDLPTYRVIYDLALSRRFPASQNKGGRWQFSPKDLPVIAEALGLSEAYAA